MPLEITIKDENTSTQREDKANSAKIGSSRETTLEYLARLNCYQTDNIITKFDLFLCMGFNADFNNVIVISGR